MQSAVSDGYTPDGNDYSTSSVIRQRGSLGVMTKQDNNDTEQSGKETTSEHTESWNWFDWLPSWKPTSEKKLEQSEQAILSNVKSQYTNSFVRIGDNMFIRTISFAPDEPVQPPLHPLVLVHGLGYGLCSFYKNYDYLHKNRHVYAFDVLGLARSSRTAFSSDNELVEDEFVESIEKWRHAMSIEKMILLGHSVGAYWTTTYAFKYPDRVRHLVLIDPWGFQDLALLPDVSVGITALFWNNWFLNPYTVMRWLGPIGPWFISYMRSDIGEIFGEKFLEYAYHCNALNPTGESAFFYLRHLSDSNFAQHPLMNRLDHLASSLPLSVMFGVESPARRDYRHELYSKRSDSFINFHYIEKAGHHIQANRSDVFNDIMNGICEMVDANEDLTVHHQTDESSISFYYP